MSMSATHRLRKAEDKGNNVQRVLRDIKNRDIKNHLLFEQATGGKVGSIEAITPSSLAKTSRQQQQTVETIQTKMMANFPRELQTTRSMPFEQFCSSVSVCIPFCLSHYEIFFIWTFSLVHSSCYTFICTIIQYIYESVESGDYTCDCDSLELFVYCSGTLGEYYSLLVLSYDATIQDYSLGIDCACSTPTCDTSPTSCVAVDVTAFTCLLEILLRRATCAMIVVYVPQRQE
jgi:hypothetical protein